MEVAPAHPRTGRQGNGWRTAIVNDSGEAQTGTDYACCLQP